MRTFAVLLVLAAWAQPAAGFAGAAPQSEYRLHPGPQGYHAMCARAPRLCMHDRRAGRSAGSSPPVHLGPSGLTALQTLNAELNQRIRPTSDLEAHGVADHWSLPGQIGDCEDYVIAKKQALLAHGWSADQLLYAVVQRGTGHHAVLIVRTDRGELVLDNLHDQILTWQESGYRFVTRQSASAPDRWVHLTRNGASAALFTR
ncbi:MAG: transglutaminase-like cysteine peptidase [Pseudomonadota bacterium]